MEYNLSQFRGKNLPVEKVFWGEAEAFTQILSRRTGRKVRLPTEAEWEYACRASTTTEYYFGNSIIELQRSGWYRGNSENRTHPVMTLQPNAFGLTTCTAMYTNGVSIGAGTIKCSTRGIPKVRKQGKNALFAADVMGSMLQVAALPAAMQFPRIKRLADRFSGRR